MYCFSKNLLSKKFIDISHRESLDEGCHGSYYKLTSNLGVKVLWNVGGSAGTSKCLLFRSKEWQQAKDELKFIKVANSYDLAPKAYKVVPVKANSIWLAGILMEHVSGGALYSYIDRDFSAEDEKKELANVLTYTKYKFNLKRKPGCIPSLMKRRLKDIGILWRDGHDGNIVIKLNRGKVINVLAIDFSPDCTEFIKPTRVIDRR